MATETTTGKKKRKKKSGAGGTGESFPAAWEVEQGVAHLVLDAPGKKVNTLSRGLLEWLDDRLGEAESSAELTGVVIRSGKPNTFVAGADIEELEELDDKEDVRRMLEEGHALMKRLSGLPIPVVAAIDGACLGGGLELALACDWRVASDNPKTKLGLPEVQLGLIPGLGGTQRLPRLIGVPSALDLILTGKQVRAKKAFRLGLVDEVCHPAILQDVALDMLSRGKRSKEKSTGKQGMAERVGDFLAKTPLADKLVYDKARAGVMKKTGGHYPAPLKAVDVVKEGLELSLDEALRLESAVFVELVVSPTAKNLMGIFFMKNDVEGRASKMAAAGRDESRVGVLGAGLMGAGIAQVLAYNDVQVVMKDQDHESLGKGMSYCADRFNELERRRKYREVDTKTAMARIHPTVGYEAFRNLDFVVEAVFEDIDVKHEVIREVEAVAPDDLIFASNTSTIPIAELAEASERPENVVGMHFFSPVHKMPLIEVIRHEKTSDETVATTVALGETMGKTIIVVNDGPGFFTSRVLGPYVQEAVWCLTQGAKIEEIDSALTSWGWPVGALTLLDEVGLDVGYKAGKVMIEHFGERLDPPDAFQKMLDDGRKGRKTGRGFYLYDGKKKKGVDESVYELLELEPSKIPAEEIQERCWLQMLNEVARTMEDGIVENPTDVDVGVIFGLGFPPFRGGILKEADRLGLDWAVERLEHYADEYGERFTPAQLLVDMANKGEKFRG